MKNTEIIYRYTAPEQLTGEQLDEVCRLVEAGGGVDSRWLRHNLEKAYLIARAEVAGELVGVSSLKRPRAEYVQRIRKKLGLDIEGFLERGYTSIRPEYRGLGIGTTLLGGLTSRAEGYHIYSLIREDDRATQTIALRNRTVKIVVFFSELTGKELGLWMPAKTAAALGLKPIAGEDES